MARSLLMTDVVNVVSDVGERMGEVAGGCTISARLVSREKVRLRATTFSPGARYKSYI
jgi:hypothetical protein